MAYLLEKYNNATYRFSTAFFKELMQLRVFNILLYCSNYNAFMLEEDGAIEEKIHNEYNALKLSNPPRLIQKSNFGEAVALLKTVKVDLIIIMSNTEQSDIAKSASEFKDINASVPIISLSHMMVEKSDLIKREVDYSFCWLGNAEIILAIVKLTEDKLNAARDIGEMRSQAVLVVEDSPRVFSELLPLFYTIMFRQSTAFKKEGITSYEQKLRMRGRPKILLATSYEEAMKYYSDYSDYLLGAIVDGTFTIAGEECTEAGHRLIGEIRQTNKELPILMHSFNTENTEFTAQYDVQFIHKSDAEVNEKISYFFFQKLAFGAFHFKKSRNGEVLAKANNLSEFRKILETICPESIFYHAGRGSFTRWFKARALFQLAELTAPLNRADFDTIEDLRKFLISIINAFRTSESIGRIEEYDSTSNTHQYHITKIGSGSLGGKARGLAFFDRVLRKNRSLFSYSNSFVSIPKSLIICADIFTELLQEKGLQYEMFETMDDDNINNMFTSLHLPPRVHSAIAHFAEGIEKPVVVRSSSVLEDSYYRSFAGIYSSYFVGHNSSAVNFVNDIGRAVLAVYASVFYKTSRSYINAIPGLLEKEQMAVVIQEACGEYSDSVFYPVASGVARSRNIYPFPPEMAEDGTAQIAIGLGQTITGGGVSLRFNPCMPDRCLQLSSVASSLSSTQKTVNVLDCNYSNKVGISDTENIKPVPLRRLPEIDGLENALSVFDIENNMLREGSIFEGRKVVTFSSLLKHKTFPVSEMISKILEQGELEFNNPVEIEFALEFDVYNKIAALYLLQIRPFSIANKYGDIEIDASKWANALVKSEHSMGHGCWDNVKYIVFLNPRKYTREEFYQMASQLEELNQQCIDNDATYVLIGPGRWGSSDPHLGCPVKWSQISNVSLLVEVGIKDYVIDPSYGSHFFHNLADNNVGYFTCNVFKDSSLINFDWLTKNVISKPSPDINVVTVSESFSIMIDSRTSKGVVIA